MSSKPKTYVYRNLHKKCYSLKRQGIVENHARIVLISTSVTKWGCIIPNSCGFKVNPAGRARAIRENQRNVHAFAFGDRENIEYSDAVLTPLQIQQMTSHMRPVTYSPFLADTFVYSDTGEPVGEVEQIFLMPNGVMAAPVK